MKRKRRGLFSLLIASYVLFAVSLVATLVVATILATSRVTGAFVMPDPRAVLSDTESPGAQAFLRAGGWLETLDAGFQVTQVVGTKADTQERYLLQDILAMLDPSNVGDGDTLAFRGFARELPGPDGPRYLLAKIPRDALHTQVSVNLSASGRGSAVLTLALIFLSLFTLNSVVLTLFLRRRIKRPLAALSAGMDDLRAGKSDVRLDFSAQMEFEDMKDTFNFMAEALEREKQEKADNENKKNQMLLDLSHDIKTPIATIKAMAGALQAGLVRQEDTESAIKTIESKADRVHQLTDDLFSMLKMGSADYQLQLEETDLAEMLRAVLADSYDDINRSGKTLEIDVPDGPLMARVDRSLIRRVLDNLLSNALKYNKTGSLIRVVATLQGGRIELTVADDGVPIAETDQPHLFNAFSRGDRARQSDGGSGLGLAIAKAIVDKHAGAIGYRHDHGMNCFSVNLPQTQQNRQSR